MASLLSYVTKAYGINCHVPVTPSFTCTALPLWLSIGCQKSLNKSEIHKYKCIGVQSLLPSFGNSSGAQESEKFRGCNFGQQILPK